MRLCRLMPLDFAFDLRPFLIRMAHFDNSPVMSYCCALQTDEIRFVIFQIVCAECE